MTWSVVLHDADTGAFAEAVATCAFAVPLPELARLVGL